MCGVAAVVHGPALGGDFVYDDQRFVALNPALGSLTHVGSFFTDPSTVDPEGNWEGIYRPLRSLSYAVDHAFFGVNPVGYHVHNLLLHIAASLALGVLLGRLLRQTTLGLVLGVLFLVHPANVESVAWITSRADLQAGLLAFLTLLVMRSTGRGATILGTTLLALAVFAKESAVVVPVLGVLLARRFPTGRARSWRADMRRWAPGLAVVIVYLVIRQVVLGEHGGQRTFWGDRWSTTAASMVTGLGWYVWRFLLPVGFRFDYQLPLQTSWLDPAVWLLGAALAGGVLLAVFSVVRGGRLVSVGAGVWWFLIALGPVSNVVVPINILVAERFLYLPAAGGLLAVGGAGLVLSRRGAGWRVAAIGVAGVFFCGVGRDRAHLCPGVDRRGAALDRGGGPLPGSLPGLPRTGQGHDPDRSGPGDLARTWTRRAAGSRRPWPGVMGCTRSSTLTGDGPTCWKNAIARACPASGRPWNSGGRTGRPHTTWRTAAPSTCWRRPIRWKAIRPRRDACGRGRTHLTAPFRWARESRLEIRESWMPCAETVRFPESQNDDRNCPNAPHIWCCLIRVHPIYSTGRVDFRGKDVLGLNNGVSAGDWFLQAGGSRPTAGGASSKGNRGAGLCRRDGHDRGGEKRLAGHGGRGSASGRFARDRGGKQSGGTAHFGSGDEDEAGVQDLRRLGLELLVRPRGGAEALAETIAQRLKGTERLLADATGLDDVVGLRGRLLELVEGSEERLLRTVLEDPDTHLLNGTYVKAWRVEEEWLRSRTTQAPLSLLRVGLDGGSSDLARRHGVDALRDVEQRLAGLLLSELSGNDLPAREGNGRFLVLMPDTTADEAARRAFAVRGEFAEFQFQGRGGPFQISLCMGLAAIPHQHVASAADLLTRADEALEAAAAAGTRARVFVARSPGTEGGRLSVVVAARFPRHRPFFPVSGRVLPYVVPVAKQGPDRPRRSMAGGPRDRPWPGA